MGTAFFKEGLQMKVDHDRPLLAYAYLAQTGDQNDILSGLVPIVSPIAQENAGKQFDAKELCEKLTALYGIEIHPWVSEELIPNLVNAGVLIPSDITNGVVRHFYAPAEKFENVKSVENEVRSLVDEFIAYCIPLIPSDETIDKQELEATFLNQLISLDFHTSLLKPGVSTPDHSDAKPILSLNKGVGKLKFPTPKETQRLDRLRLLCATFIVKLKEENNTLFSCLIRIASGAIAAEYILNLSEPNTTTSLKGMKFYLDGPLVMSYLDLSEPQSFTYVNLLLQNLLAKGAILCIFNHHVEEIADNLRAALRQAALGNGHRATYRRLRQANFRSYVESVLANLETTIRRKQIAVIKTPTTPETYFSQAQQSDLLSRLGNYAVHARDRDASAIAGVIRLRQGNIAKTSDFHQSQHIFVTDNANIAKRAAIFLREEKIYQEWDVPAAITDRHLAGLVLVLFGAQAVNEIARQKLIANCASALEPSEELLSSITNFLSGLDDNRAEHFRAIMTTQRSAQYMTRFMLEQKLTLDKVEDAEKVLAHLEEQWKTTLRAESQEDADRVKKEYEEVLKIEREATSIAAAEIQEINSQFEQHKIQANDQHEANQIELSRLRESLLAIEQARVEAENREKQLAKYAVEKLFRDTEGENHKRLAFSVKAVLAISLIVSGIVTYWALAPDSLIIKALIVAGALTLTFISSALAGKSIENWSKSKAHTEFFSKLASDYIIQRHIACLDINYSQRKVSMRTESTADDASIYPAE
jgi:hypothetical protein